MFVVCLAQRSQHGTLHNEGLQFSCKKSATRERLKIRKHERKFFLHERKFARRLPVSYRKLEDDTCTSLRADNNVTNSRWSRSPSPSPPAGESGRVRPSRFLARALEQMESMSPVLAPGAAASVLPEREMALPSFTVDFPMSSSKDAVLSPPPQEFIQYSPESSEGTTISLPSAELPRAASPDSPGKRRRGRPRRSDVDSPAPEPSKQIPMADSYPIFPYQSLSPPPSPPPTPSPVSSSHPSNRYVGDSLSLQPSAPVAKTFVLDTNVILHDSSCIGHFGPHDLAIPITVLEELDRFKKGNEVIIFHAREFLRQIDELTRDASFLHEGVPLGSGLGRIRVALTGLKGGGRPSNDNEIFRKVFNEDTPDHRILHVVYQLKQEAAQLEEERTASVSSGELRKRREVILVSKDVNLRMKARALGLKAEDYTTDRVNNINQVYTGKRIVDDVPLSIIDALYCEPHRVPVEAISDLIPEPRANENFILRCGGSKSVLATYDGTTDSLVRVSKEPAYRISPRNAEQAFALHALLDDKISLVSVSGSAGTGKTLLALAAALEKQDKYQQIYLARPIVPLSNRDLGYLPGDMNAKIDPYMQPLYDNLGVIRHQFSGTFAGAGGGGGHGGVVENEGKEKNGKGRKGGQSSNTSIHNGKAEHIRELLDSEKLVITPLAYIRGRSFQEVFFIVDEAQNLTPLEIKTIITRAGEGTKIVFTGDPAQIDTPYLDRLSNGLSYLISKMSGQPIFAHITLEKGERSVLAKIASDLL
mmetsp:Transcript_40414/g.65552  ORF Transcript_40414/g.65552 Transcript_40414/m.65552 type:complete len:761 (+) Transcript_40414:58-2340(+)